MARLISPAIIASIKMDERLKWEILNFYVEETNKIEEDDLSNLSSYIIKSPYFIIPIIKRLESEGYVKAEAENGFKIHILSVTFAPQDIDIVYGDIKLHIFHDIGFGRKTLGGILSNVIFYWNETYLTWYADGGMDITMEGKYRIFKNRFYLINGDYLIFGRTRQVRNNPIRFYYNHKNNTLRYDSFYIYVTVLDLEYVQVRSSNDLVTYEVKKYRDGFYLISGIEDPPQYGGTKFGIAAKVVMEIYILIQKINPTRVESLLWFLFSSYWKNVDEFFIEFSEKFDLENLEVETLLRNDNIVEDEGVDDGEE